MTVTIGDYSLCDGTTTGGVATGNMRMLINRSTDVVLALGETVPKTYDRVGRTAHFTFQVARVHATAEVCEAFIASLDASLPSDGTVTITLTGNTETVELRNGKVLSHQSNQTGATSFTDYTLIGGPPLPVVFGKVLLETGDFILTETNYKILLG